MLTFAVNRGVNDPATRCKPSMAKLKLNISSHLRAQPTSTSSVQAYSL